MDLSKLRQKVWLLNKRRDKLLKWTQQPTKMVRGSLYQMQRYCGNPNCRCTRGEKHTSWYLSQRVGGKTKLTYIGRVVPIRLRDCVYRYQQYQRLLSQIRKIDKEISLLLNQIRDMMVRKIEEVL